MALPDAPQLCVAGKEIEPPPRDFMRDLLAAARERLRAHRPGLSPTAAAPPRTGGTAGRVVRGLVPEEAPRPVTAAALGCVGGEEKRSCSQGGSEMQ